MLEYSVNDSPNGASIRLCVPLTCRINWNYRVGLSNLAMACITNYVLNI